MPNTSVDTSFRQQPLTSSAEQSRSISKAGSDQGVGLEKRVSARDEMNVQILQASAEVSLKAGDESQALLFRSAIDRINEVLAPTLGSNAIESKMSEDNSPKATAERILSLSTGFYEAYAAQRPGDDPDQVATDFVELIRGGFEKGFNEAKDILEGLKVFSGDIESSVMKTYDLVHKGYDEFLASKLSTGNAADDSEKIST